MGGDDEGQHVPACVWPPRTALPDSAYLGVHALTPPACLAGCPAPPPPQVRDRQLPGQEQGLCGSGAPDTPVGKQPALCGTALLRASRSRCGCVCVCVRGGAQERCVCVGSPVRVGGACASRWRRRGGGGSWPKWAFPPCTPPLVMRPVLYYGVALRVRCGGCSGRWIGTACTSPLPPPTRPAPSPPA